METKNIEQIKELTKKTKEGKIIWTAHSHDCFGFEQEIESGNVKITIQKLQQHGYDDYYFYVKGKYGEYLRIVCKDRFEKEDKKLLQDLFNTIAESKNIKDIHFGNTPLKNIRNKFPSCVGFGIKQN